MFDAEGQNFSPNIVDQQIRNAAQICWAMLPDDARTTTNLKAELMRIVERICEDFEEDLQHFAQ